MGYFRLILDIFYSFTNMKKLFFILFLFVSCSLFSQNIRKGSSSFGTVLYNFDGENLRKGSSSFGTVLYNFDGENIRKGSSSFGTVLYNFDGENIRKGSSSFGTVLFNIDGYIPKPILIMLCM